MFLAKRNWKLADIAEIQEICKKNIELDHPPPRPIIQGTINLEYFVYHHEASKMKLQILQNKLKECDTNDDIKQHQLYKNLENQHKITQRKLNNRDLQLKQFRNRITKLESVNQKMKIQLTASMEQIESIHNKADIKIQNYIEEIMDLKKIIQNLEPNEISSSDEQSSESNRYYASQEESRSESSLSNSQDRDFRASDDDVDMNAQNDDYIPGSQSVDDTESSSSIS